MSLFLERHTGGERALLVHLKLTGDREQDDLEEFENLVQSAGCLPVKVILGSRVAPHPKWFVGSGKLVEMASYVQKLAADVVIFNHSLSASQERNLEIKLCCKVIDRTTLILDIFSQRARTHEGKLQVELAQLQHLATKLIRGWTHLERQQGGIGTRGPGETQLEFDKRLVRNRVSTVKSRLIKVQKQREQNRLRRARSGLPVVSLVGYTNVGKSQLFNQLTRADVFVKNQLFATLDPTMRKGYLNDYGSVIFADTVGFMSNLPHRLIEAFRATLEEVCQASLLLHVVDLTAKDVNLSVRRVKGVLSEIGAQKIPTLMVYNKTDIVEAVNPRLDRDATGKPISVYLSGRSGAGIEDLRLAVASRLRLGPT